MVFCWKPMDYCPPFDGLCKIPVVFSVRNFQIFRKWWFFTWKSPAPWGGGGSPPPRGNFHAGWEFSDPRGVGIWLRLRQLCVPTTYLVRIINNMINNDIIFKWYDFQVSIRSDDTPPLRGGEKKNSYLKHYRNFCVCVFMVFCWKPMDYLLPTLWWIV